MKKIKVLFVSLLSVLPIGFTYSQKPSYLDTTLSVEERVKSLMDEMTLEEKIAQLDQFAGWNIKSYKENPDLLNKWGVGSWVISTLTAEEYNELQALSEKSRLKIPFLIGSDAAHGLAQMPGSYHLSDFHFAGGYLQSGTGKPYCRSCFQRDKRIGGTLDFCSQRRCGA